MPGPRDRGREVHVGVLMLLYQMSQYGFGKIPPVTLAGIAIMSMMFTGMIQVPWSKEEACVSSNKVLKSREYSRLFISAFEHGDDMHLYYNMISFLVKGVSLERKLGSPYFAYLILMFSTLCSLVYIGLANGMAAMFNQPFFLEQCAIGFSGFNKIFKDILEMQGFVREYRKLYLSLTWRYTVPATLLILFALMLGFPFVENFGEYLFPVETMIAKFLIFAIFVACMVVGFILAYREVENSGDPKTLIRSTEDWCPSYKRDWIMPAVQRRGSPQGTLANPEAMEEIPVTVKIRFTDGKKEGSEQDDDSAGISALYVRPVEEKPAEGSNT